MKINLGDIFKNDMCHFENIPLEIQLWELKQSITAYVCELQLENVHMLFFENITCVKTNMSLRKKKNKHENRIILLKHALFKNALLVKIMHFWKQKIVLGEKKETMIFCLWEARSRFRKHLMFLWQGSVAAAYQYSVSLATKWASLPT